MEKQYNILVNEDKNIISFGKEKSKDKDVVLSYDNVIKEAIYDNAIMSHCYYEKAKDKGKLSEDDIKDKFLKLSNFKKLSNLYAIANVFFKISLMKLANVKEEFKDSYLKNKEEYHYDNLIKEKEVFSKQDVLAYLEHERWNAFEIGNGALPLKIKDCIRLSKDAKSLQTKVGNLYHLCITTQKGLCDYYNLVSSLGYNSEADTVKYDYELMNTICINNDILDYFIDKL